MLKLKTIKRNLRDFNKVIVTGPPRSGTTIGAMIIADILGYQFIDESFYDADNSKKFMWFLTLKDDKMVIQTTGFLRDLYKLNNFVNINSVAIVLMDRSESDIIRSFKNSEKFTDTSVGIIPNLNKENQDKIKEGYNLKNDSRTVPEIVYSHFYSYIHSFDQHKIFKLGYDSLSQHKLFVEKRKRRSNFAHMKQVKLDDPYFLLNQKPHFC